MKSMHKGIAALGVAIFAVALTGCSSGSGSSDQSSGDLASPAKALGSETVVTQMDKLYAAAKKAGETKVVTYGPGEQLYGAAYKTFMKRYPDIQVTGEYIFGAELSTRLEQEFSSGKHVGSVLTAGPAAINASNKAQQCESYTPFTSDFLPSDLVGEGGTYHAVIGYPFGIAYNTDSISKSQLPKTYADLSDPKFKGKFVLNDPTTVNGTSNTMAAMESAGQIDEKWVADVAANDPMYRTNAALATQAVATGQAAFDPFSQYVTFRQSASDGLPIAFYFPLKNSRIEYHDTCLLKGGPNPDATKLFLNWLYTPEGQNALASTGVYGIRPGTAAPEGLPPFDKASADLMPTPSVAKAGATTQEFLVTAKKYFQK